MTEQFTSSKLRFYLTEPQPCPYLPNRVERKIFTPLTGPYAADISDELSINGFRRSQNVAYRPQCPGCNACIATRIVVNRFEPSRRDRRVMRKNAVLRREVKPAIATEEQYQLFRRYLTARHSEGGMAQMDAYDYASMIEDSTVRTQVIEYWGDDEDGDDALQAVCLIDVMADGLSMVYSFFDPARSRDSMGRFMILDHIEIVKALELRHVYLGYWIDGCQKMSYKVEFPATEVLVAGHWMPSSA